MTAQKDESKDKIIIFDTTLRDGEQSPGCSMNKEEKLVIAGILDRMSVDIIEAGFPVASPGDFEAVQAIAETTKNARVAALSRAILKDIDVAAEALKPAGEFRIHTFISTSPQHLEFQLKMTENEVLEAVKESVTRARSYTDDVEWSGMDATRSDHDFLCRCVEAAVKAGATTINVPDTVGYAVPEEFAAMIRMIKERVPGMEDVVISTHCHNDLGLAVANSLAGVHAGARQIECTINGIGERAGNASLEEIIMALKTRADTVPVETDIDTTMIMKASRALSAITGFNVQPNKAIVGANAFAHESGIHQDGMLKNRETYEIMTPESVGLHRSELVLGKHSGRHAFRSKLTDLGYELDGDTLQDAFERFKVLADKKREVFDEDIIALVDDAASAHVDDRIKFVSLRVQAGTEGPQSAVMGLEVDGEAHTAEATGNGPIDAIFQAIRKICPHPDARLKLYQVSAVTGGTDAQAEVTIKLEESSRTNLGHSADVDTLVASARAYIDALNQLLRRRDRLKAEVDV